MDYRLNKFDIVLEIPKMKRSALTNILFQLFQYHVKNSVILTASSQFCLLYVFVVFDVAILSYKIHKSFTFALQVTTKRYEIRTSLTKIVNRINH